MNMKKIISIKNDLMFTEKSLKLCLAIMKAAQARTWYEFDKMTGWAFKYEDSYWVDLSKYR